MRYPRIIAHRCGGALAPENTLAGLRVAARLGCRGVEFDAMLGADGIPVLMHDETLERTTLAGGPVANMASAEILRLDAGARHHPAFAGEAVPTLAEALRLCAALDLWANVEIKPAPGQERETGRVVARAARGFDKLVLSSFSMDALREAAAAAEELPRALLVDSLAEDWGRMLSEVAAGALHIAARRALAAPLQAALDAGVPVACYTVNQRDESERLFAMGAIAVFTDRPDLWTPSEM